MILKASQLDNVTRRKDGSTVLRFITQEQTPQEIAELFSLIDKFGYLAYKPEETLTRSELNDLDSLDTDLMDGAKTQSQRLRNVLYVSWKQNNEGHEEFKEFYKQKTEKIIQSFKDKLL